MPVSPKKVQAEPNYVVVELTDEEFAAASIVAGRRAAADESGFRDHLLDCLGEIAVCLVTGQYWPMRIDLMRTCDIGEKIVVVSRPKHDDELVVPKDAVSWHYYFLVTGLGPQFRVWGWIPAAYAEFGKVSKSKLKPVKQLKEPF